MLLVGGGEGVWRGGGETGVEAIAYGDMFLEDASTPNQDCIVVKRVFSRREVMGRHGRNRAHACMVGGGGGQLTTQTTFTQSVRQYSKQ
jgi:hypothetical protein